MNRSSRQHGFTLLELILAMTMVSLLAMSLYTSLRTGFKARDSSVNSVSPVRAAEAAIELIRNDLESALPPTGTLAGEVQSGGFVIEGTTGFRGVHNGNGTVDTDEIQFYSIMDGPESAGYSEVYDPTQQCGVCKVRYYITQLPDSNENVLVREVISNLLGQIDTPGQIEIICRNVASFSIQYVDPLTQEWLTDWDSVNALTENQANALPGAVMVSLVVSWPEQGSSGTRQYRTTRIFPLSCYFDPTMGSVTLSNNTSGSTTGGTSTGGTTGGSASGNNNSSRTGGSTGGGSSSGGLSGGGSGGSSRGGGR